MVSSLSDEFEIKVEKILVGITVQHNSRRLIDKGAEVANIKNGQLHILHVQKGNNIFLNSSVSQLLQELYQYGSELGGEIHAICGDDVCKVIIDFVKKNGITHMVLGEKPKNIKVDKDVLETLKKSVPDIEFTILKREEEIISPKLKYKHKLA